jgi:hypothetical protein
MMPKVFNAVAKVAGGVAAVTTGPLGIFGITPVRTHDRASQLVKR